jgi:hypothetical protein
MAVDFFEYREIITSNLLMFIRHKGYSKLSFSKVTGVPRFAVDQILKGEEIGGFEYNAHIQKVIQVFDLPDDYFLAKHTSLLPQVPIVYSERSNEAQILLDGLDNILDIYSMYLK